MTNIDEGWGGEPFVPKSDYDDLTKLKAELDEKIIFLSNEVVQLRDALTKVNQGIHKASEENIIMQPDGSLTVRVDDWRRCREIAMDLLHIPMQTNLDLIIKLENGYLRGIKQK